jgi:hypothetical protein
MTIKLTKTQSMLLEEMKEVINKAKKYDTFESYFKTEIASQSWAENYTFSDQDIESSKKEYELALQNIVRQKANTKTFEKLAKLGLIEVLQYDEGYFQQDLIKVK